MKTYITFGQKHKHIINDIIYDKDCVAVINHAKYEDGRELTFKLFNREFCMTYEGGSEPNMSLYPRGLIEVN